MCGRYTETKAEKLLRERFGVGDGGPELKPRYNIAPTQDAPVVVQPAGGPRELRLMRWGLVPYWSKDPSSGAKSINARVETLETKSSFEGALRRRRCLVPADGFFEWTPRGGLKVPTRFVLKGEALFGFAGLWDRWKASDGTRLESFTIVTGPPNELVARVHDRMPVILRPEDEAAWLDPDVSDPARLKPLLRPYPAGAMDSYEVSRLVNNARVDEPDCVKPAAAQMALMPC